MSFYYDATGTHVHGEKTRLRSSAAQRNGHNARPQRMRGEIQRSEAKVGIGQHLTGILGKPLRLNASSMGNCPSLSEHYIYNGRPNASRNICSDCGKSFPASDDLEVHILTDHYYKATKTQKEQRQQQQQQIRPPREKPPHGRFHFSLQPVDANLLVSSGRLGTFRGIQGENNSCYLDAALMAMFYANDTFDEDVLCPTTSATSAIARQNDNKASELQYCRTYLTLHIVNVLRRRGFVPSLFVVEWRRMIDQYFGGGINFDDYCERQESCDFVRFLLEEVGNPESSRFAIVQQQPEQDGTVARKPRRRKSPENIHQEVILQLLPPEGSVTRILSSEELLNHFFKSEKLKFKSVGKSLILQLPRHGSRDRVIGAVVPTPSLYTKTLTRQHGHSTPYFEKKKFDLRAVVVIGVGHFVAYLRVSRTPLLDHERQPSYHQGNQIVWLYYDSMSDRVDEENVPLLEDVTDELYVLERPNAADIVKRDLSFGNKSHLRRIMQDASMLFYGRSVQPVDTEDDIHLSLMSHHESSESEDGTCCGCF